MWVVRKAVIIHALKICPDVARSKLRTGGPLSSGATGWAGGMSFLGEKKGEGKAGGESGELTSLRMDPQGRP